MADGISFSVRNVAQLKKVLKTLPEKLRLRVIRKAVRRGAEIFKDQIIANAPVLTGATASNVTVSVRKLRSDSTVLVALAGIERAQFYAKFVEFGTKTQPAKPFMRPAFESRVKQVQAEIGEGIRVGIKREAKRLR